jgi:hypothetical protein
MELRRLYKDDDSSISNCPSVYDTGEQDLVVQGVEVDPETAKQVRHLAAGERAVRINRDTVVTAVHRMRRSDDNRELEPTNPEYHALFDRAQHSVFRLELLQHYADPDEAEAIRRWQAGEPVQRHSDADWWAELVRRMHARGGAVQRVHVVVEPPSDYIHFELAMYAFNVADGEDVRILPVGSLDQLVDLPGHDFWLFDSQTLAVLRYTEAGELDTVEVVDDPAAVVRHNRWRDVALAQAIPYRDYMLTRDLAPVPFGEEEVGRADHVPA